MARAGMCVRARARVNVPSADVSPARFSTACWLLHPSWHMCVYKRMFESENKVLSKEGVLHFLELFEAKRLPFAPEVSEVTPPPPPPPGPLCPGRGVRAPVASHVTLRTRRRPRRQRVAPGGFALRPPQSSGLRRRMWTGLAAVAVAELPASFPPPVSKRRGSGRENRRRSFSPTCWPRGPGARVPGPRTALASARSRCCCYTQYVTEAVISLASLRPFVRNRTKQRLRMTLWL